MVKLVVGTHALLQSDVIFPKLGLVIIDEQHRFGVRQRLALMEKGAQPDVLVMTATPIPRTLALTLYGDLDVSVIDELPPGRQAHCDPARTGIGRRRRVQLPRTADYSGRQAYVVYPIVEETESTAAVKAAEKMFEHLSSVVFPRIPVGLLHGRIASADKEAAMARFKAGETKILVATTVIEVGVDVPNASIIVIEQAERFGLAQIHQLRGRVGRGAHQSYCILVTGKLNDIARERIRTVVESNDGFYIAEMDMKLRGPGEFYGTKQSGIPVLRLADLLRDADILEQARNEAHDGGSRPAEQRRIARCGAIHTRQLAAALRTGAGGLKDAHHRGTFSQPQAKAGARAYRSGRRRTAYAKRFSMFSRSRIEGTVFLDAYAGTGAVGIEALSRGASRIVLIEKRADAHCRPSRQPRRICRSQTKRSSYAAQPSYCCGTIPAISPSSIRRMNIVPNMQLCLNDSPEHWLLAGHRATLRLNWRLTTSTEGFAKSAYLSKATTASAFSSQHDVDVHHVRARRTGLDQITQAFEECVRVVPVEKGRVHSFRAVPRARWSCRRHTLRRHP